MFCFSASSASLFRISSVSDVLLSTTTAHRPFLTEVTLLDHKPLDDVPASRGLSCTVVMGCTCPVTRM